MFISKLIIWQIIIKINLIDGEVMNLQGMSLLGIRSRLPPISYSYLLVTFLEYGVSVIKTKWIWNRSQTSLKCNLFNAFLEYWFTHFRCLDTGIYLQSTWQMPWFVFATVEQSATEHCFIIIGSHVFAQMPLFSVKSWSVFEVLLKVWVA